MTSAKVWNPSLFDTNMTLEELIKSFPVSTRRSKGFFDEDGDLILKVQEAERTDPNFDCFNSDKLLSMGSDDAYTVEKIDCIPFDDTNMFQILHHRPLLFLLIVQTRKRSLLKLFLMMMLLRPPSIILTMFNRMMTVPIQHLWFRLMLPQL